MAGTDGFRRRVQPPATLIERRPDSLVAGTDGALIDHGRQYAASATAGIAPESSRAIRFTYFWALPKLEAGEHGAGQGAAPLQGSPRSRRHRRKPALDISSCGAEPVFWRPGPTAMNLGMWLAALVGRDI